MTAIRLSPDVCDRALDARDARFDGIFFVGITTTGIYCRPICPARVSYRERRRFFDSAALAERAGFRPCLRCRPELAPGRALCDAVPRLARVAAQRIAAGALNGSPVSDLGRELGVSDRHLRRVLERELGVSPVELAQTHRLLLAKRLLADTSLSVTRIAYASGFQSLRRFNTVFRERYRLSPTALRRSPRRGAPSSPVGPAGDLVRLTLAYRGPLAWDALLGLLAREALPGVELVDRGWYVRTVQCEGRRGIVCAAPAAGKAHLDVDVSPTLLPVLMSVLARLRHVFDLDAEPAVVDSHLERAGLGVYVARRPGLRIPGAFDGFEAILRTVLGSDAALVGEPFETGIAGLDRIVPAAASLAETEAGQLMRRLGIPGPSAELTIALARAVMQGTLQLEPGSDVASAHSLLLAVDGLARHVADRIVAQALHWPDAFDPSDRTVLDAAGARGPAELTAIAERWRPWRAYATLHLRLGNSS